MSQDLSGSGAQSTVFVGKKLGCLQGKKINASEEEQCQ